MHIILNDALLKCIFIGKFTHIYVSHSINFKSKEEIILVDSILGSAAFTFRQQNGVCRFVRGRCEVGNGVDGSDGEKPS
eukprot:15367133-Ditylum_brightwellii.AAC.1